MNSAEWLEEGQIWKRQYDERLQYVMAHMNHHIHPVTNVLTGERRPLRSCCKRDAPNVCKGGFPLENEMTEDAILVCACIAQKDESLSDGTSQFVRDGAATAQRTMVECWALGVDGFYR